MGIIIGESEDILNSPDQPQVNPELMANPDDPDFDFPEADYDLQNEIIRFFSNNPGAEPELFRQFASSIGVEPDELQKQMNILFSQLLQLYLEDAENLGYGDVLGSEGDIPEDIAQQIAAGPGE